MVEWLPETDEYPPRPDVAILRHLTWTESHAAVLGGSFAFLVYWGMALGRGGVVFGVAVTVAQLILGEGQRKSKRSKCEHRIGVHDLREEPWYFAAAAVVLWIALATMGGVP